MYLPTFLYVLIGVVVVALVLVLLATFRRREHALRDRFAEEYDRTLHDYGRRNRP